MNYTIGDGMAAIALAAGVVGWRYVTHRSRLKRMEMIHQERLAAMEKGIPLPELPLDQPKESRDPDTTTLPLIGTAFLTLGVGAMVVLHQLLPPESLEFWIAPFPLAFLGIGLIVFHFLTVDSRR